MSVELRTTGLVPQQRHVAPDDADTGLAISIIVPTARRIDALRPCLESVAAQTDAPAWELLVCCPPDPKVRSLVTSIVPQARLLSVAHATPAARRNAVLGMAAGQFLLFLDDDAAMPPGYLVRLYECMQRHPDVDVFGGPNLTPKHSPRFEVVQGAVLSSLIGSGPVRRRYGPHPATEANERWFTLCNLAIRRSTMPAFDDELVCAEENELLTRMTDAGSSMRYEPDLWCSHQRRSTWRGFAEQMFKYGRGRGQLSVRSPHTLRPAYLAPTVTIALILAGALTALGTRQWVFLAPVAAYLMGVTVQAARIAGTLRRPRAFLSAATMMGVLHLSYGTGVFVGAFEPRTGAAGSSPTASFWLLKVLVHRQLLLRRKRSVLGIMWPLLTPLFMLAIYIFVFHSVLHVPIAHYGEYLFAGLLPWTFLSQTLGVAVTSISSEAELVRRSRFSFAMLPIATEIAASIYFLATVAGFVVFLGVRGDLIWVTLPTIVLPLLALYLFVGGLACLIALVDVYNRDLRQVLNNVLTVWFFLVPIVYRQNMISPRLHFMRSIDPANLIVGEFRDVLYFGHLSRPLHSVELLVFTLTFFLMAQRIVRHYSPLLPKDV
jgi:ABC-type polysaccharide/polyol phosphate export permease/GT2 family glycosyltransferase